MNGLAAIESAIGQSAGIRWRRLFAEQRTLWSDGTPSWMVVGSPSEEMTLLAVANGREAHRRMREVLAAFLGPMMPRVIVATPDGLPAAWIVEQVLVHDADAADQAIQAMNAVRSEHLHEARAAHTSVDVLLRELHLALEVRDETASMRLLEAALESGLLSQENTMFLRVKVLSTFGRWNVIKSLRFFDDLSQMRRPTLITSYLLETLWHEELPTGAEFFDGMQLRQAFAAQQVGQRYRDLFCSVECPATPRARTMVALYCAHIEDPVRLELLVRGAPAPERPQLQGCAGLQLANASGRSEHIAVDQLLGDGDFAGVLQCFDGDEIPSRWANEVVFAAVEMEDPDVAMRVLAAPNLAVIRASAPRMVLLALDALERLALGAAGWAAWARHLAGGEWGDCIELVRQHSDRWPTDWVGDVGAVEAFATDLETAMRLADADRLGDVALELLDLVALSAGKAGHVRLQELVLASLVLQRWDGEGSRRGVVRLLGHLDRSNLPVNSDVVDAIGALWDRDGSMSSVPWLVQCLELLQGRSEVEPDVLRVVARVAPHMARLAPKVDRVWMVLFRRVAPPAALDGVTIHEVGPRGWQQTGRRHVLVGCDGWDERATIAVVRDLLGDDAPLLTFVPLENGDASVCAEVGEVDLVVVSPSQSRSPVLDLGRWPSVRVVDASSPAALLSVLVGLD